MTWTCPSCGQEWPEKPLVDGTIGCPSCGNVDPLLSRLALIRDRAIDDRMLTPGEATDILARLSASEQERDQLRQDMALYGPSIATGERAFERARIAEQRAETFKAEAEAALEALREIAAHEGFLPNRWSVIARAALAGREETGGG